MKFSFGTTYANWFIVLSRLGFNYMYSMHMIMECGIKYYSDFSWSVFSWHGAIEQRQMCVWGGEGRHIQVHCMFLQITMKRVSNRMQVLSLHHWFNMSWKCSWHRIRCCRLSSRLSMIGIILGGSAGPYIFRARVALGESFSAAYLWILLWRISKLTSLSLAPSLG